MTDAAIQPCFDDDAYLTWEDTQSENTNMSVASFRRTPGQDWPFHVSVATDGDCLFPSLDASIPFDEIFEDVDSDQRVQ